MAAIRGEDDFGRYCRIQRLQNKTNDEADHGATAPEKVVYAKASLKELLQRKPEELTAKWGGLRNKKQKISSTCISFVFEEWKQYQKNLQRHQYRVQKKC